MKMQILESKRRILPKETKFSVLLVNISTFVTKDCLADIVAILLLLIMA